jgi:2-polyprenyl-3-methyl-5-hydroxy-6-metoxy-1,4-benzoquinol methylase
LIAAARDQAIPHFVFSQEIELSVPKILIGRNALVMLVGFSATLLHGDTLVWDRWRWLKRRLPRTANGEALLDVGCGTGAFTIGAAKRGYKPIGLSWDARNQAVARERAALCGFNIPFPIQDVRALGEATEYANRFDIALCLENIEHILDDFKLVREIAAALKPGGLLLLTTPNYWYREISRGDRGPFCTTETGWHVRRGYTSTMLRELCSNAGLKVEEISTCSGFFSQKVTGILRRLQRVSWLLAWVLVMPMRLFPPLFDPLIRKHTSWPDFSICLVAYKPRWAPKGEVTPT